MKIDIFVFFDGTFISKPATAYIYIIFATKKVKITKNIFDKKPFITGIPIVAAPTLRFL